MILSDEELESRYPGILERYVAMDDYTKRFFRQIEQKRIEMNLNVYNFANMHGVDYLIFVRFAPYLIGTPYQNRNRRYKSSQAMKMKTLKRLIVAFDNEMRQRKSINWIILEGRANFAALREIMRDFGLKRLSKILKNGANYLLTSTHKNYIRPTTIHRVMQVLKRYYDLDETDLWYYKSNPTKKGILLLDEHKIFTPS